MFSAALGIGSHLPSSKMVPGGTLLTYTLQVNAAASGPPQSFMTRLSAVQLGSALGEPVPLKMALGFLGPTPRSHESVQKEH